MPRCRRISRVCGAQAPPTEDVSAGRLTPPDGLRSVPARADEIRFPMIAGLRPIRQRLTAPAARVIACLTACAVAIGGVPARAQAGGPPIIRDAEIEQLLRDYTQP